MQTTVLLADINDFATMNNIYKQFFTHREPARAAYQVIIFLPILGQGHKLNIYRFVKSFYDLHKAERV